MQTISIIDAKNHVDEKVKIGVWLTNKRSSGKIAFLQLRDGSAFFQGVVPLGGSPEQRRVPTCHAKHADFFAGKYPTFAGAWYPAWYGVSGTAPLLQAARHFLVPVGAVVSSGAAHSLRPLGLASAFGRRRMVFAFFKCLGLLPALPSRSVSA